MSSAKCRACNRDATYMCSRCNSVPYCGLPCQLYDRAHVCNRIQTREWNEQGGNISVDQRIKLADDLASGSVRLLVGERLVTLADLFQQLKDKHVEDFPVKPFSKGADGHVFRFATETRPEKWTPSIVIKYNTRGTLGREAFFCKWLSDNAVRTGACHLFPVFMGGNETMYALEYAEYNGMFPDYFDRFILRLPIKEARQTLAILFFQLIYAFYVLVGLNGHPFRHQDLHGRNIFIRRTELTKQPRMYPVLLGNAWKNVAVPDIGAEVVVGDFGRSSYLGFFDDSSQTHEHDLSNAFTRWVTALKDLRSYDEVTEAVVDLQDMFRGERFPKMERILANPLFQDLQQVDCPVTPPFRVKPPEGRFSGTHWTTMPIETNEEFDARLTQLFESELAAGLASLNSLFERPLSVEAESTFDLAKKNITTAGFFRGIGIISAYQMRFKELLHQHYPDIALTQPIGLKWATQRLVVALPYSAEGQRVLREFLGLSVKKIADWLQRLGDVPSEHHALVLAVAIANQLPI